MTFRDRGLSWREIGAFYTEGEEDSLVIGERIRSQYRRWKKKGINRQSEHRSNENLKTSICGVDRVLSDDELLKAHGYNPDRWEIVDSSTSINSRGAVSRVRVAPKKPDISVESIRTLFDTVKPVTIVKSPSTCVRKGYLVVPLFDMHYGKTSVDENDKSLEYFEEMLCTRITELASNYSNIIFLIGQDMFNMDSIKNTTTLGTQLDASESFYNCYKKGYDFLCRLFALSINMYDEVFSLYTAGNHDRTVGYAMAVGLSNMFPQIKHSIATSSRTYFTIDEYTLVGVTHGENLVNISGVMANERAMDWGMTKEHIWIIGHKHNLRVEEKEGMTIYNVPSPSVTDYWHDSRGYQSKQRMVMLGIDGGVKNIYLC